MTEPEDDLKRLVRENNKLRAKVEELKAQLKYVSGSRLAELELIRKGRDSAVAERDKAWALYHDLCARIYDRAGMIIKDP